MDCISLLLLLHTNSQGEIIAIMMLDREERETYTLIVKAVDSAASPNTAYSTVITIIIIITDNHTLFH